MALMLLALPASAPAQGWSVEPAAGIVIAGPLFRDAAVEGFSLVDVTPAPAPLLALHARTAINPRWSFDLALSWSPGTLQAEDGSGRNRELSSLHVIAATAGVRRPLGPLVGAVGVGGISYRAPDARAYAEGSSIFPAAQASLALPLTVQGLRSHVEASVSTHRHQTPVLERAGADAALVWRAGLTIGVELGGTR